MATFVRLGGDKPGIMAAAAERFGGLASQVSNSAGDRFIGTAPDPYTRPPRLIGTPMPPPEAESDPIPFVANTVRLAVEDAWGHHYGYFDALAFNDLDEAHVLRKGQIYYIPARAARASLTIAAKWRERFGRS